MLNRIDSQWGAALVNNTILQSQIEALQAENARLKAQLASSETAKTEAPELV